MVQELRFSPLFSGSSGNAIYVGCGNTHLLVDAGLSGSRIIAELKRIGVAPEAMTAILTTHEHVDHIRGVGILSRKLHIPVYATRDELKVYLAQPRDADDFAIAAVRKLEILAEAAFQAAS